MLLPLAMAGLGACDVLTESCTAELEIRLEAETRGLRVGESFVPAVEFRGCQGRKRWRPDVTWRTADTLVAAIDSARGRVTGRARGEARVYPVELRPNGEQRPFVGQAIRVTVQ